MQLEPLISPRGDEHRGAGEVLALHLTKNVRKAWKIIDQHDEGATTPRIFRGLLTRVPNVNRQAWAHLCDLPCANFRTIGRRSTQHIISKPGTSGVDFEEGTPAIEKRCSLTTDVLVDAEDPRLEPEDCSWGVLIAGTRESAGYTVTANASVSPHASKSSTDAGRLTRVLSSPQSGGLGSHRAGSYISHLCAIGGSVAVVLEDPLAWTYRSPRGSGKSGIG